MLAGPLKLDYVPITRVENFCASGSEAFRNACYAVASGASDMAMAIGVEKLKDSGYSGLTTGGPSTDANFAAVLLAVGALCEVWDWFFKQGRWSRRSRKGTET